jgi:anti-anti-sigma factor
MSGEVDIATAAQFRADLLGVVAASPESDVVLDCADLRFVDSSAVRVLVEAHRLLESQGRGFRMINVPRVPRRRLETFGLIEVLRIERTRGRRRSQATGPGQEERSAMDRRCRNSRCRCRSDVPPQIP